MNPRVIRITAAVFAFAACAAGAYWWLKVYPMQRLEKEIAQHLVDPESAQFRNVVVSPSTGAACGEVNARNRMGGFVGFTGFTYRDGQLKFRPEERGLGSNEARIDELQKLIAYLKEEIAACPEAAAEAAEAASAAKKK